MKQFLETHLRLYAEMAKAVGSINNATIVKYRSFITTTYGEEALHLLKDVEAALVGSAQPVETGKPAKWAVYNPKQDAPGEQHAEPQPKAAPQTFKVVQFQPTADDTQDTLNQTEEATQAATTQTETASTKAVAGNGDKPELNFAEVAAMQPSEVKERYTVERLRELNTQLGITYRANASHTQLAAMLVNFCKQYK